MEVAEIGMKTDEEIQNLMSVMGDAIPVNEEAGNITLANELQQKVDRLAAELQKRESQRDAERKAESARAEMEATERYFEDLPRRIQTTRDEIRKAARLAKTHPDKKYRDEWSADLQMLIPEVKKMAKELRERAQNVARREAYLKLQQANDEQRVKTT